MLFQQLSQSPVFRGISPDEMENLLVDSQYQIKKFSKGDMLAFREDKCENLMIVLKRQCKRRNARSIRKKH